MNDQLNTRSLVQAAAIELMASGETPTPKKIRDMIGKGSNTTIAEELSAFFAESSMLLNPEHEIPVELGRHLRDFWKMAIELAEKHHEKEVESFDAYIAQAVETANRLKALLSEKDNLLDVLTAKSESTAKQLIDAQQSNTDLQQKCALTAKERDTASHELKAKADELLRLNAQLGALMSDHALAIEELTKQHEATKSNCSQLAMSLKESELTASFNAEKHETEMASLIEKHEIELDRWKSIAQQFKEVSDKDRLEITQLQDQLSTLKNELKAEALAKNNLFDTMSVTKLKLDASIESSKQMQMRLDVKEKEAEDLKTNFYTALGKNQALHDQVKALQEKLDAERKASD